MNTRRLNPLFLMPAWLPLLLAAGCFQIETRVQLHEDGSATITERYQLSRRLMEFEGPGGGPILASELTKDAVLERIKLMGKGVTLVSHEQRDCEGGGRESVSVFNIPDVSEFQYASPYLALPGYAGRCLVKFRVGPHLRSDIVPAGMVGINFEPVITDATKAKVTPPRIDEKNPPKGPSPAELQALRHLQPVIRDLLEGIHLKFTVESYAPVFSAWNYQVRNGQGNTREFDLIDFSDKNLDAFGANFLENEEIMLELEQMHLDGPNVTQHLGGAMANLTVPLFYVNPRPVHFPPSRHYFDKLFAGKTLSFPQWAAPDKTAPARFEDIGWPRSPAAKP